MLVNCPPSWNYSDVAGTSGLSPGCAGRQVWGGGVPRPCPVCPSHAFGVGSFGAEAMACSFILARPCVGGCIARRGITRVGLHPLALPVRLGRQRTPAI